MPKQYVKQMHSTMDALGHTTSQNMLHQTGSFHTTKEVQNTSHLSTQPL